MKRCNTIHSLISELTCDPDVQKVSVNSTLNKRYIRDDDEFLVDDGEERETDGEERETDGEERETDHGKERERDHDKERETDDGEERGTDDGEERETDDGEERETEDVKERETEDGEERETINNSKGRETENGEERETDDGKESKPLTNTSENLLLITGGIRGKALIICNNLELSTKATEHDKKISQKRMRTLPIAQSILAKYFGLSVSRATFIVTYIDQVAYDCSHALKMRKFFTFRPISKGIY